MRIGKEILLGEQKLIPENCLGVVASLLRYTGPWAEYKDHLFDLSFFVNYEQNGEKIMLRLCRITLNLD